MARNRKPGNASSIQKRNRDAMKAAQQRSKAAGKSARTYSMKGSKNKGKMPNPMMMMALMAMMAGNK